MHKVPVEKSERGSQWPEQWPLRLEKPPYWLNSQVGVYGKGAMEDFTADYQHWKNVVSHSYLNGMGINWSSVRNVMDMRALYMEGKQPYKDSYSRTIEEKRIMER